MRCCLTIHPKDDIYLYKSATMTYDNGAKQMCSVLIEENSNINADTGSCIRSKCVWH